MTSVADPAQPATLRPRSLAEVPEVERALRGAGLGIFAGEPTALRGRNDNWLGRTTSGQEVFVKQITGTDESVRTRVAAVAAAHRVLAASDEVRAPELLAVDEDSGVVVFRRLDATDGGSLLRDDELTDAHADRIGQIVAATHRAPVPPDVALSTTPSPLPPMASFTALPVAALGQLSAAELETWSLLQRDRELVAALTELRREEQAVSTVPIHGDLRLDQFLVSGDQLWLCDWEEFRLGDPARDLGALIGELLNHAFSALTETEDGGSIDHASIMRRGTQRLEEMVPTVRRTVDAYQMAAAARSDDVLRAFRFAGWHLIDRLLAAAHEKARLHPLSRAVAGIGRSIVTDPTAMYETVHEGALAR